MHRESEAPRLRTEQSPVLSRRQAKTAKRRHRRASC
uniref:Uncharacterized protein n=1 Tax=Anguilla anguilla TaxID=7936 RepID=A0A0E9SCA5_ANGAN